MTESPNHNSVLESEEARRIVAHNLQVMENSMYEYVGQESIGGNAGSVRLRGVVYPCAGIKCLVDLTTGAIDSFRFAEHYDPAYQKPENKQGLMLRVATKTTTTPRFYRIMEIGGLENGLEKFSSQAQDIFRESVRQYNEKHGRI